LFSVYNLISRSNQIWPLSLTLIACLSSVTAALCGPAKPTQHVVKTAQHQATNTTQAGAKAPSNGATVQVQNAYLGRLRSKLSNNWLLPDGSNRVELTATVNSDGTIEAVQVSSTPKNDSAEQSASDAFSKSQPLETLPSGIQSSKLTLVFTSKADPHGDSNSNINTKMEPIQNTNKPTVQDKDH